MHPRGEEPNSAFKRNILTFKVIHPSPLLSDDGDDDDDDDDDDDGNRAPLTSDSALVTSTSVFRARYGI